LHINELKNYEIEHSPIMMHLKKEKGKRGKRKKERNLFGKLLDERF
jgi:hypothetical protein